MGDIITKIRKIITILISLILIGCGSYPLTTFYVKNTSDKPISFNATVMKHSQTGPFYINQPFTVQPKDSVLTRKIGYKIDGQNPQNWFTKFKIFPIDSLEFNDPKQPQNWVKSLDKDGKPMFTFKIVK